MGRHAHPDAGGYGGPTPTVPTPTQAVGRGVVGWCGAQNGTDQREFVIPESHCDIGASDSSADGNPVLNPPGATVDLGTVYVGTPATTAVTLSNQGGDLVSVSKVAISGADFSVTNDQCTYAILERTYDGDGCSVTVSVNAAAGSGPAPDS